MTIYIVMSLSFLASDILLRSVRCEKPKIAILGAGIGGSSCAHFINELLGDRVHVDVFEAAQVGGRLATIEYEGSTYEAGGAIIHERNKYMRELSNLCQLKEKIVDSKGTFGIYDGEKFDFMSSEFKYWTLAKMVWRYGYWSLKRLNSFIEAMLDEFDNIYKFQKKGRSFATAEELMAAAGPLFSSYFNVSSKDGFASQADVNHLIIDDLIRGSLRVNYGQSTDVPLFVGSVSVAGMFGSLWSVDEGNKRVAEELLKRSSANIHLRRVTKVTRDPSSEKYLVESTFPHQERSFLNTYDVVVVANPITSDSRTPIDFQNFTKPVKVAGSYQRTVATFVSGRINGSYFNLPENGAPDLIINNNVGDVINSLGTCENARQTSENGEKKKMWKVFSQRPLTEDEIGTLFQKSDVAGIFDWLAYPRYDRLQLASKFLLDRRLFYVNAIEWAASAMEMSVIGAKNVALLVQKELADVAPFESTKNEKRETTRSDL